MNRIRFLGSSLIFFYIVVTIGWRMDDEYVQLYSDVDNMGELENKSEKIPDVTTSLTAEFVETTRHLLIQQVPNCYESIREPAEGGSDFEQVSCNERFNTTIVYTTIISCVLLIYQNFPEDALQIYAGCTIAEDCKHHMHKFSKLGNKTFIHLCRMCTENLCNNLDIEPVEYNKYDGVMRRFPNAVNQSLYLECMKTMVGDVVTHHGGGKVQCFGPNTRCVIGIFQGKDSMYLYASCTKRTTCGDVLTVAQSMNNDIRDVIICVICQTSLCNKPSKVLNFIDFTPAQTRKCHRTTVTNAREEICKYSVACALVLFKTINETDGNVPIFVYSACVNTTCSQLVKNVQHAHALPLLPVKCTICSHSLCNNPSSIGHFLEPDFTDGSIQDFNLTCFATNNSNPSVRCPARFHCVLMLFRGLKVYMYAGCQKNPNADSVEQYVLNNVPDPGLKPLAYRHCSASFCNQLEVLAEYLPHSSIIATKRDVINYLQCYATHYTIQKCPLQSACAFILFTTPPPENNLKIYSACVDQNTTCEILHKEIDVTLTLITCKICHTDGCNNPVNLDIVYIPPSVEKTTNMDVTCHVTSKSTSQVVCEPRAQCVVGLMSALDETMAYASCTMHTACADLAAQLSKHHNMEIKPIHCKFCPLRDHDACSVNSFLYYLPGNEGISNYGFANFTNEMSEDMQMDNENVDGDDVDKWHREEGFLEEDPISCGTKFLLQILWGIVFVFLF